MGRSLGICALIDHPGNFYATSNLNPMGAGSYTNVVVEETSVGSMGRGVGWMPAGGPRAGTGSCTSAEITSTGGCYKIQVFKPHSHPPPPTSIQSYLINLWCRPGLVLFKNSPCNSDAAKAYTGR